MPATFSSNLPVTSPAFCSVFWVNWGKANRMEMNAVAAEYRVGPPDSTIGALSRAEVAADLSLWNKSGMAQVADRDSFDPTSAAFERQFSSYQSMRNGPEFVAEIQRIKGMASSSTQASFGSGAAAN